MWAGRQDTPLRLAVLAMGGALYTFTLLAAALLLHGRLVHAQSFWLLRTCIAPVIFVPGFAIQMRALHLLRRGVRKDLWREEDLDALRTQINRPVWTFVSWLLLASMMLVIVVSPVRSTLSIPWLLLWLPAYLLMDLRLALRKPISSVRKTIDWSTAKPLRSDHWGHQA